MMKFMAQNGFFLLVVGVWMMMSAGLYAEESRFACRVVVKDLKDVIVFKDPDDPRDGGLTVAAREAVSRFRKSRYENIAKLISLFHIESLDAILEWGGGLSPVYHVILFSDGKIYRASWDEKSVVFAKSGPDNESVNREIREKLENLSRWSGEAEKFSADRTVLFMTFYGNGIPQKAFYADFPEDAPQKENGKTCFNELRALLQILRKVIRADIRI